jgi:transposase
MFTEEVGMRRTEWLQETRMLRFEEAFSGWTEKRLTQEEAARLLGVCERTFRRYVDRYEELGLDGLVDKRLVQASRRKAPVDEVMALVERYRKRHKGWRARHFHAWYKRDGGRRSYTFVKLRLQEAGLLKKAPRRGAHRKRRDRSPWPGMMLLQDGSTHQWVPGQQWDLIVTMDDATSEHYAMFFVEEEGTKSSFQATRDVIRAKGLFSSLYTDRGSHYWNTPTAGGKVDKKTLTQFGRAMAQLGIEMIPSYSPEARGRIERAFRTHQDRLHKELALHGIADMEQANRYLQEVYLPAHNAEFSQPPLEEGSAFVECVVPHLDDILCEQYERQVGGDNCVSFEGRKLQIPADRHRCHYVKATVKVHRYLDDTLAVFHGPRKLACYDADGVPIEQKEEAIA